MISNYEWVKYLFDTRLWFYAFCVWGAIEITQASYPGNWKYALIATPFVVVGIWMSSKELVAWIRDIVREVM